MSFKDIKGQDRAIFFLQGSIEDGRLPHAYIFHGPGGIGKKLTALNFAKALNCLGTEPSRPCDPSTLRYAQGRPEPFDKLTMPRTMPSNVEAQSRRTTGSGSHPERVEGCDTCASCRKIDSSNHPDIYLLKPLKEGGPIKVEYVRDLIKDIVLKPYEAKKKIYVIDEANNLTEEASNALLKTLEEPPSDSILILIAERLNALLPTIVSRAQAIKFFPLAIGQVRDILVRTYGLDGVKAHVLAHLASGRLGEALKLKSGDLFERRTRIINSISDRTLFDSDFEKQTRVDLKIVLNIMLTWYRDILITRTLGDPSTPEIVNMDKKDVILAEAERFEPGKLDNIIKQIISTISYLDQNANPKLAMAALGISL